MTFRIGIRGATLPNLISVARLVSAPVVMWLIVADEHAAAFWLFLIAGISDAVDGTLARVLHARSVLGSYLDPIADKALLMGVFFALGYRGDLPGWLVAIVVSRDVFILGGAILVQTLKPGAEPIAPSLVSKTNTALQIILAAGVLALAAFGIDADAAILALSWIVATTTVISGFGYLVAAGRRLSTEASP